MKNQLIRVRIIVALFVGMPFTGRPAIGESDLSTTESTRQEHAAVDRLVLAYRYPWYGYKEPRQWD